MVARLFNSYIVVTLQLINQQMMNQVSW